MVNKIGNLAFAVSLAGAAGSFAVAAYSVDQSISNSFQAGGVYEIDRKLAAPIRVRDVTSETVEYRNSLQKERERLVARPEIAKSLADNAERDRKIYKRIVVFDLSTLAFTLAAAGSAVYNSRRGIDNNHGTKATNVF